MDIKTHVGRERTEKEEREHAIDTSMIIHENRNTGVTQTLWLRIYVTD